jgi:hypothetical protein
MEDSMSAPVGSPVGRNESPVPIGLLTYNRADQYGTRTREELGVHSVLWGSQREMTSCFIFPSWLV